MEQTAQLPGNDRIVLFRNTAGNAGITEGIAEKDFWVCWTLNYLFHVSTWRSSFAFKGGTSLSKCFHLIRRFSEDIDLILDWRIVGCDICEPWIDRSRTQQDRFNKAVNDRTACFLKEEIIPEMDEYCRDNLKEEFRIYIDPDDPLTVCFRYPRLFSEWSVLPVIRLELGTLAGWTPTQEAVITPFAAEQYPHVFRHPSAAIRTVSPERSFWEKAVILHKEAFRRDNRVPHRYSRHYYDLWCMADSSVKKKAYSDLLLLKRVTAFCDRFYHSEFAHYDLAKPGTMRLMPPEHSRRILQADYDHMKNMIYGRVPDLSEILLSVQSLETEINQLI